MSDRFGMPIVDCRTTEERLREQVAAQAAVIEKLREVLLVSHDLSTSTITRLLNTLPTDSTKILAEVRRAERERCAKVCMSLCRVIEEPHEFERCAAAIRAME